MSFRKTRWKWIVAINLIIGFLVCVVLHLWDADIIHYPLYYNGDARQVLYSYQTYFRDGIFLNNSSSGIPYISNAIDFSSGGYFNKFLCWLVLKIFNNYILGINFLYLIGFFLVGNVCFYVLKRMNFSNELSFFGAVIYTFLPRHFLPGFEHIAYTWYWFLPLFIYYLLYYFGIKDDKKWGG